MKINPAPDIVWYENAGFEPPCSWCLEPIKDDEVPLILWRDVGGVTWQAQFHNKCAEPALGLKIG
jgi:hypothetical protein